MSITRRQALGLMAGGAAAAAASGCGLIAGQKEQVPSPVTVDEPNTALLNRFGFGPRPGQAADISDRGQWLEDQLKAPEGEEDWQLMMRLRRLDIFHFTAYELRDLPEEEVIRQLQAAAILRSVHSKWQLRERMADFWTNHFNIFARKGLAAYRKPQDEREVVRAHVFGKFPEMLLASAKSTAMLLYLDQQASSLVQPNENYARELLELHSMGVDGGYTQKDVMEVARCFTGWTEERQFLRGRGQFKFRPDLHDDGEKRVLGHVLPSGGGVKDGEKVIEIVATHPSTARHVAGKLCRFFLGRDDDEVRGPVAAVYRKSGGDIAEMLREVFSLSEAGLAQPTLKRPFDFVASAIRALDGETDGWRGVQDSLTAMGQPLYQWPMPDGYPDATEAWTGSLLARWNFALALAEGRVAGTSADTAGLAQRTPDLAAAILGAAPESRVVREIEDLLVPGLTDARKAALILASPTFQWR